MIVGKMISIVDTARHIWKREALSYIRVVARKSNDKNYYAKVEATSIDEEHLSCWDIVEILPSEVEPAREIIRMINFKGENVRWIEEGIEVYVKSSPRTLQIEKSISALKNANFYSELHQEDGCVYSCILKNTEKAKKDLKRYLQEYRNVECHYEYGIYEFYM